MLIVLDDVFNSEDRNSIIKYCLNYYIFGQIYNSEKKDLNIFLYKILKIAEKYFDLQNLLVDAKLMIVRKLETVKSIGTFVKTDDGFRITAPEGFVAVDRLKGNAVKLVDRLEFSQANFNAAKNWDK